MKLFKYLILLLTNLS